MTDLTGLAVHAKDVAPIVGEGANMLRDAYLGRYAMVVPGALMRIQVKRIVANHAALRFFDAADDALAWLGWEASDRIMAPPG
ncbi:hypothetical protein [Sphingomonas molluscorum]|uniref:hypothetical protein n=1 Tax=Sphingomonas molluscorum TaxID=418184 RepID=UPI0031D9C7DA